MEESNRPRPRKKRDRARTESDLFDAVERLLERDGVLAGLNLNEVAAEANVNRGQIYQLFGSRQELLRAALAQRLSGLAAQFPGHWDVPFAERRRRLLQAALSGKWMAFMAMLALDGDEQLSIFDQPAEMDAALQRDKAYGALPPDVDAAALHVLTAATVAGYVIFREVVARDVGLPVAELDQRVSTAFDYLLDRITSGEE
ncbi:TetR/AcrR family transcriptional regulator [Nocardia yamanashiensis]|uniref:TetR/AcrR family transcriptional regulator n=1 Tax=Nocardia yamanashiensis TaxID=209247 RepID=UPI001E5F5A25|nr:TetR/AcrR family transcriptional regulator [Nocardia yamanashiensis]UGT42583.1 TetR/AcrR family transcriptional regulator [Nocardia yamanashiensis]